MMAMVHCAECKAEISSQAKACPKCGAPPPKPKRTSRLTLALVCVIGAGVVAGIAGKVEESTAANTKPPTPEEAAAKAARIAAEATAMTGAQILKRAMKDPESFQLKQLLVMPDGTACYTYRAINSFNAKLQSTAVLVPGKNPKMLLQTTDGQRFVDAWNKRCTKQGEDITDFVARRLD